jgi:tRNA threonylcarbamoyladenosine biosynthesis protein TsaE
MYALPPDPDGVERLPVTDARGQAQSGTEPLSPVHGGTEPREGEILRRTHSAKETRELGACLAETLKAGDVILLEGPLGAGKSELARGIAQGLGIRETVTSPSFTILNVYTSGRLPLYHFDWYRLESAEELYELGMDEYLGGDGIALVEWPGRCPDAVPVDCLRIRIGVEGENARRISTEVCGGFRPIALE